MVASFTERYRSYERVQQLLNAAIVLALLIGLPPTVAASDRLPILPAGPVLEDPSFDAFRQAILTAASNRNRAILIPLFASTVWWEHDSGLPEQRKASPRVRLMHEFGLLPESLQSEQEWGLGRLGRFLAFSQPIGHGTLDYCLPGE